MIAVLSAMAHLVKFRVDLEYASATMLRILRMFAMLRAELALRKHHLHQTAEYKYSIQSLKLRHM